MAQPCDFMERETGLDSGWTFKGNATGERSVQDTVLSPGRM